MALVASLALKGSKISLEDNKEGKEELEVLLLETSSMNLKSFSVDNKAEIEEEAQAELLHEVKTLFCKWK